MIQMTQQCNDNNVWQLKQVLGYHKKYRKISSLNSKKYGS